MSHITQNSSMPAVTLEAWLLASAAPPGLAAALAHEGFGPLLHDLLSFVEDKSFVAEDMRELMPAMVEGELSRMMAMLEAEASAQARVLELEAAAQAFVAAVQAIVADGHRAQAFVAAQAFVVVRWVQHTGASQQASSQTATTTLQTFSLPQISSVPNQFACYYACYST